MINNSFFTTEDAEDTDFLLSTTHFLENLQKNHIFFDTLWGDRANYRVKAEESLENGFQSSMNLAHLQR